MSAVEILAEASWVVFFGFLSEASTTHDEYLVGFCVWKAPGGCGPLLAEVLKVMKADLTKNFESYGRQVMGFGGSRKSPKNGIPLWENPIKLPPWHSWLLFPSFLWCFTEKDWPCFWGVGCTTMACNPRFQQDNEYQRETVHVFLPMVLYWRWHCRILFVLASICLDEHLPSPKK